MYLALPGWPRRSRRGREPRGRWSAPAMHATVSGSAKPGRRRRRAIAAPARWLSYLPGTAGSRPGRGDPPAVAGGPAPSATSCPRAPPGPTTCARFVDAARRRGLVPGDQPLSPESGGGPRTASTGRGGAIVGQETRRTWAGWLFVEAPTRPRGSSGFWTAFKVPLLFWPSVPGFMIGTRSSAWVIRHGAKDQRGHRGHVPQDRPWWCARPTARVALRHVRPAFGTRCRLALPSVNRGDWGPSRRQRRLLQRDPAIDDPAEPGGVVRQAGRVRDRRPTRPPGRRACARRRCSPTKLRGELVTQLPRPGAAGASASSLTTESHRLHPFPAPGSRFFARAPPGGLRRDGLEGRVFVGWRWIAGAATCTARRSTG